MNLQITVPYQTCPFKCPFCIANDPNVQSKFDNAYHFNKNIYFKKLLDTLIKHEITTVVLTGDTEPTLNMEWVNEVATFVKAVMPQVAIEIQTKNFNHNILRELALSPIDVIALSFDTHEQIKRVQGIALNGKVKRATVVLNSEFNVKEADFKDFQQVTFKAMQQGNNDKINSWINDHLFNDYDVVAEVMRSNPNISFFYDENCMITTDRYLIFRSDANIYNDWASTTVY